MTPQELRNLIDAVAEAGGPLAIHADNTGTYVKAPSGFTGSPVVMAHIDVAAEIPQAQDRLAGALKRDLIERGLTIRIEGDHDTWTVIVIRNAQLPSKLWVQRELAYADGDSELEALLHAWTDAAQLEGWGA